MNCKHHCISVIDVIDFILKTQLYRRGFKSLNIAYQICSLLIIIGAILCFSLSGCAGIYANTTTKVQPSQINNISLPAGWKFGYLIKTKPDGADCAKVTHFSAGGQGVQQVCAGPKLASSLRQILESSGRLWKKGSPIDDTVADIGVAITSLNASPPISANDVAVANLHYRVFLVKGKEGVLLAESGKMVSNGLSSKPIGVPPAWAVEKAVALASQNAALDILSWCSNALSKKETPKAH